MASRFCSRIIRFGILSQTSNVSHVNSNPLWSVGRSQQHAHFSSRRSEKSSPKSNMPDLTKFEVEMTDCTQKFERFLVQLPTHGGIAAGFLIFNLVGSFIRVFRNVRTRWNSPKRISKEQQKDKTKTMGGYCEERCINIYRSSSWHKSLLYIELDIILF